MHTVFVCVFAQKCQELLVEMNNLGGKKREAY